MNIVLIGKPGSGKGTLAQQLVSLGWRVIAPGEIMREKMKEDDEVGQLLRDLLNKGNYAPDHITIGIVREAIARFPVGSNVIFDGFPRTPEQAQMLLENFSIDRVVYLETEDQTVKDRLVNRLVHTASGRVYNTLLSPPKTPGIDDVTGEALTTRDDDKLELIEQRLKNFREKTYPSYEYLVEKGVPSLVLDADIDKEVIKEQVLASLTKKSLKA